MGETKGRVLLVTSGKELLMEMTPSMAGRGMELVCVPTLKYAADRLAAGDCSTLVVDFGWLSPSERGALLELHKQFPKIQLFTLESVASMAPAVPSPLRRLSWPLPMGFADQARVIAKPVIILADQVLFSTGAVQNAFQQAGVQAESLEYGAELPDFIRRQSEARAASARTQKPRKGWSLLGGSDEPEQEAAPAIGNLVVAQFTGALDAAVRAVAPEAVCYLVSGVDTQRYAMQALREGQPVALPREQAGRIANIMAESAGGGEARLKTRERERILLLDNFKPALTALSQALIGHGYEVTSSMDGAEALRLTTKGSFHLAVVGTAITMAELSGAELAEVIEAIFAGEKVSQICASSSWWTSTRSRRPCRASARWWSWASTTPSSSRWKPRA